MEINSLNQEIRLAQRSEKDIVVKIIMGAFQNDPHMNWLIEKSKSKDKLQIVCNYVVEETFNKGEIYLTKDNLGAALWCSKKKEKITLEYLKRNMHFLFTMGITTVYRALKMAKISHSHFPKTGDFCYLYIIGVLPEGQGQGLASRLMNPVIEKCRNEKVPAFLETANLKNVEIYKKKGFEVTDSLTNNKTTFYYMSKKEKILNTYDNMQRIDKSEIEQAKKIFASAMFNDDLHKYFFPDEKSRIEKLEYLYEFKLKTMLLHTYKTSEKYEGFCIWEKPNEHHSAITFNEAIKGFSLVFNVGIFSLVKMIRYQFWSTKQKKRLVSEAYWYLDTVVVSPDYQGKGFASKMIKPFLSEANANGDKVYLETQNIKNVLIYEKYGFKLISTQYFNKQITHFAMVK